MQEQSYEIQDNEQVEIIINKEEFYRRIENILKLASKLDKP